MPGRGFIEPVGFYRRLVRLDEVGTVHKFFWLSGIGAHLGRNKLLVRFLAVLEEYHIPLTGSFVCSLPRPWRLVSVGAFLQNPQYFHKSAPVLCSTVIIFMEVDPVKARLLQQSTVRHH